MNFMEVMKGIFGNISSKYRGKSKNSEVLEIWELMGINREFFGSLGIKMSSQGICMNFNENLLKHRNLYFLANVLCYGYVRPYRALSPGIP